MWVIRSASQYLNNYFKNSNILFLLNITRRESWKIK
jgi:hypothetical protein